MAYVAWSLEGVGPLQGLPFESPTVQVVVSLAMLMGLLLVLLAAVSFVRQASGDGLDDPPESSTDEPETHPEEGVRRGGEDDEWDFY